MVSNRPGHAPVPNDRPADPRVTGFASSHNPDNYRFAPHKVFLDALQRVLEAMAAGVDPLPAYMGLKALLDGLGREDATYLADLAAVKERSRLVFDALGHMDRLTFVQWRLAPMASLMIRKGVIRLDGLRDAQASPRGTTPPDAGAPRTTVLRITPRTPGGSP